MYPNFSGPFSNSNEFIFFSHVSFQKHRANSLPVLVTRLQVTDVTKLFLLTFVVAKGNHNLSWHNSKFAEFNVNQAL